MKFENVLNNYIDLLNCSSKELSNYSNLSPAAISRYRNGERIPSFNSEQLNSLMIGIVQIAKEKNLKDITFDKVKKDFSEAFGKNSIDFDIVRTNLKKLISELDMSISQIAKSLGFDSSYISRIISGQRKPSDIEEFVNLICKYIVKYYSSEDKKNIIATTIGCSLADIADFESYINKLSDWLYTEKAINDKNKNAPINNFLEKLDEFNLDEYIKAIHFDTLKVPSVPFHFVNPKNYFGLDEMKNGELDFFKATILSKTKEPIFMYNDMPMDDMAKDLDFGKKWMFAIACSLKKGLHLNMIHNLDRPFNELMLGLESWIPMYMTGQISPYYFKTPTNNVFYHTIYTSEVCALYGEGLKGNHEDSKYYLTNKKNELNFYKKMSDELLKKASPLMNIYTKDNKKDFEEFINSEKSNKQNKITEISNNNINNTFKNIKFTTCKEKWVMLSKKTNPEIHFVIYHQTLREAIENFIAPVIE